MFKRRRLLMFISIVQFFQNLPKELIVFIMSMTPLIELRGGVPLAALKYGFPLHKTLFLTITGNFLPIPFILLFIKHIFKFLKNHGILVKTIDKVTTRAMNKSDNIKNLQFWGLVLFVGIPLPATGAWTGALIASLLNFKFKDAMIAIFIGIVMAATIMSLGSYGIINIFF